MCEQEEDALPAHRTPIGEDQRTRGATSAQGFLARRAFDIVQIMRPPQRRTVRVRALRINSQHYVDMPAPSSSSLSASSAANNDSADTDSRRLVVWVRCSFAGMRGIVDLAQLVDRDVRVDLRGTELRMP